MCVRACVCVCVCTRSLKQKIMDSIESGVQKVTDTVDVSKVVHKAKS